MEKVIVTGGAGFIGSHLAEELVRRGYRVVIIDNLSTGRIENIKELLAGNKVQFARDTITSLPLLKELFQGATYIFHLAAIPSVPKSVDDPLPTNEVNITGTLKVLIAARDSKVKKVIYASSSSVYGDTPTLPKWEDMILCPQSPYAVSKLAGEYYCHAFQEVYGLPTVCLRYFNVYGPGQDPESPYAAVIPRFLKWAREGKPPVIFGDGEQTRDFTFVADAVAANILAAESNASGVFNVGTGESITINKLAGLVAGLTGKKIGVVHQEPREGDIKHSLADISKARAIGYKPGHNLERWLHGLLI